MLVVVCGRRRLCGGCAVFVLRLLTGCRGRPLLLLLLALRLHALLHFALRLGTLLHLPLLLRTLLFLALLCFRS